MKDPMQTMAACYEQVAFFFPGGDPKKQESFERRASYLDTRSYFRERLAELLRIYNSRLGANSQVLKMIEELKLKDTLTVVTGQQAGILTGPLYTLYKAMTAIRLAAEQRQTLGRPVVPIFWIAGEDHDWLEIQRTYLLNNEGRPVACSLSGDGGGRSVGSQPVPAWETIDSQLRELPEGEFRSLVLDKCRQFTEQAENLTEWFALTLQWLVQKWGIIFFDPLLPEFKKLAIPIYEQILKLHTDVRRAFTERTEAWVKLGFAPQIQPLGGEVNLFLSVPERKAIHYENHKFYLRGQEESWDLDALQELLMKEPERFSPNVVTRPIVQEYFFPVLAYVPGPGELNYWAQLGGVFETFGFAMPILYPRLTAVAITPSWQKSLSKEGLTIEDVYQGLERYRERAVREQDSHNIDQQLERLRATVALAYAELKPLEDIHPNVHDWIISNAGKVDFQINYLKQKLWQAQRKRCKEVLLRLQQLEDGIAPNHSKQERIFNPLVFVAQYGPGFVDRIAELPLTGDFAEQQVYL